MTAQPNGFRNKHLSVSRLKRYEQCPASFELHYIRGHKGDAQATHLLFGVLLHNALEALFRWVIDEEYSGEIPVERVLAAYRELWTSSGLAGLLLFQEGLTILRGYCAAHPDVDHRKILTVEREFNVTMGPFVVNGRIDRADKVDDETIEIIDYKSNRLLYSRDDLDGDLQMSIYGIVGREMFPWAKRFRFAFHLLRHGIVQRTERTDQQLLDARDYVIALGEQTESAAEFPARLNANCCYCDHRSACGTYQDALRGKAEIVKAASLDDLEAVVREHEQVTRVAKAAYGRQRELHEVIKARIEADGPLSLGAYEVKLAQSYTQRYPLSETIEAFREAGLPVEDVERALIGQLEKGSVEALLARVEEDPRVNRLTRATLRARLEAIAEKAPWQARLDVKPAKTANPKPAMKSTPKSSNSLARAKKA